MSNFFLANVRIILKPTVSDPQGQTIMAGLKTMGFDSVSDLRAGKFIQIKMAADDIYVAKASISQMCDRLLSNPVIENYEFDIDELKH
jgi:phosphoribosylformylglycinamidine synthase